MKIKDKVIRVYLKKEGWDSGLLWPFFEGTLPDNPDLRLYFRVTNCEFDVESNCYVFRDVPYLRVDRKADVYIPREFVYGLSARHIGDSEQDMRRIGFQTKTAT